MVGSYCSETMEGRKVIKSYGLITGNLWVMTEKMKVDGMKRTANSAGNGNMRLQK